MADKFGALQFPAQSPNLAAGDAVTDPRLDKIARFLQAVLNADIGQAWSSVSGGKKFVETTSTNDPSDSTFNERDLPALFIYDPRSASNQMTDDLVEDVSQVTVLWVPATAEQAKRSLRSTGVNGFKKAVERAFYLGRHPAWCDDGDTDPDSATFGSALMIRAGLAKWPSVKSAQTAPLTIVTDGAQPRHYSGFSLTVELSEVTIWDVSLPAPGSLPQAGDNAPSKVDILSTAGALVLDSLIPTT
jgi:hypothetical protein